MPRFFDLTIVSLLAYSSRNFGHETGFLATVNGSSVPTGSSMKTKPFVIAFSIVLGVVCVAASAFAQSTFGTILGAVTDASGAVMPNIVIKITNQGENISREVKSDAQGNYQAENLKEGLYTVAVHAEGFREVTVMDIRLTARQMIRRDLTLAVGSTTENVTVEAHAELINTESQTISSSFTNTEVLALPANYRGAGSTSPYSLLMYLPGVQADNGKNLSVQGSQTNEVEYTVDGISTASVRYSGAQTEMFPSAENISEMKVQGVGDSAEYGQVGDVTTTTKGGTNVFHGSGFEYFQNAALDAAAYGSLAGKPAKSANTFGASFSGPIFKNHTFFFVDYEGMRYRTQETIHQTVPTQAMRNGDYSALCGSYDANQSCNDPNGFKLQNPFTTWDSATGYQGYPNNIIPSDAFNPVAPLILQYYPLPNQGDLNVFGTDNYVVNTPNPILSDQFDIRIDHTINSKQSVFGRWTRKNSDIRCGTSTCGVKRLLLPAEVDFDHENQVVIAHSFAITPNLVNELRGGISRGNSGGHFDIDGPAFMQKLNLNGLGPFPPGGFPEFAFETSGLTRIYHSLPNPLLSSNFQINENLTWTKGKHTMKFGFDWRRLRLTNVWSATHADDYGDFFFDGQYTGNDFADFLIGIPYYTYVVHTPQLIDGKTNDYYAYAEDTFKVTPKLTLDFGVRFSRLPPFIDPVNHTNFDPSVPGTGRVIISSDPKSLAATNPLFAQNINACGPINPNPDPTHPCTPFLTAKEAHWPEGLRKTYNDFAPRVGFAYRPFAGNSTVVRGGIGLYSVTTLGSVFYSVAGVHDGFQGNFSNGYPGDSNFFQLPNVQNGDPLGIALGTQAFRTANQFDKKDPYTIQWNMSVERALHGNTALRLSYIGSRGVQLTWGPDLNQPLPSTTPYNDRLLTDRPFPNWSAVFTRAGGATSSYNAMQTELIHKYSSGLMFQSTWTWAHNLSDTESFGSGSGFGGEVSGRALNQYDLRGDWGNVGGTRRHRWITTAVYELPIGKGRRLLGEANGVLNGIVGGWRLSTIFLIQSGPFLTPSIFYDSSGTNQFYVRPDVFGNPNISNPTPDHWWNPGVFACPGLAAGQTNCRDSNNNLLPPIGRFGNGRVGTLIGPGTINLSMGLGKSFRLTERFTMKFESSFTNLPNHVNFDDPNTEVTLGKNFGQTVAARPADSGGNRVGQFALRIEF